MKYKDKHTINQHSKEIRSMYLKSRRSARRESEREVNKFELKICVYLDRDWWQSLSLDDRVSIYRKYISSFKLYNHEPISIKDLADIVRKKYSVLKEVYRDKIIDKLLKK